MNQSLSSGNRNYATRERNASWKTDLRIGTKIGRWTIIAPAVSDSKHKHSRWLCRCLCGTERSVASNSLRRQTSVSCGCYRREYLATKTGSNNPGWKGGRIRNSGGYVQIRIGNEYQLEHRFVMEQRLGRPLRDDENVHHKNGLKYDNRIENLELWITSQPSGQRPEDLVAWAEEILARYKP